MDSYIHKISTSEWEAEKAFASELTAALYYALDSLRVGVVVFSQNDSYTTNNLPLEQVQNISKVKKEIVRLKHIGNEYYDPFIGSVSMALRKARTAYFSTQEDRPDASNVAIIATRSLPPGHDPPNQHESMSMLFYEKDMAYSDADLLKQEGATIIAVGTPHNVDEEYLRRISSGGTHKNYFLAASFLEMSQFIPGIVSRALEVAASTLHGMYRLNLIDN